MAKWSCSTKKLTPIRSHLGLIVSKNIPKSNWGEAVLAAAHLPNQLPSRVLGHKSPMVVFSEFLILNFMDFANSLLEVFGCVSFVHIHAQHWKSQFAGSQMFFCRAFNNKKKGYKVYHLAKRRFSTSIEVIFFKKKYFFLSPYL